MQTGPLRPSTSQSFGIAAILGDKRILRRALHAPESTIIVGAQPPKTRAAEVQENGSGGIEPDGSRPYPFEEVMSLVEKFDLFRYFADRMVEYEPSRFWVFGWSPETTEAGISMSLRIEHDVPNKITVGRRKFPQNVELAGKWSRINDPDHVLVKMFPRAKLFAGHRRMLELDNETGFCLDIGNMLFFSGGVEVYYLASVVREQ
nr:hypothetical protein [Sorangium cellulosum]